MRILVTGVAGFIGSNIAQRLLLEGHTVVGVDVLTDYYDTLLKKENLRALAHPAFTFLQEDLISMDLLATMRDIDVVFHQAGQPGVRGSWGTQFDLYLERNIAVTQRLLEAAKASGTLKRFVYASSSSVYGDAEDYPTFEYGQTQPKSPYGVSKLAGEHLVSLYASNFGVPTTSFRYFTVYGPGQRPDMAFTRFLRAAILEEPIQLFGTGEQIRDFTFIDDIVDANIAAISLDHAPGSIFNLAGGSNVSINEVIKAMNEITGTSLEVNRLKASDGDVFRTCGSTARVSEILGWAPQVKIVDGLHRQHQWLVHSRHIWEQTIRDWK